MAEEKFLINSLSPLENAEDYGRYFDGEFSQSRLSPSLGINSISGEIGKEYINLDYTDRIVDNDEKKYFIRSMSFTSTKRYDLSILPGPDTLNNHNLEPNYSALGEINVVEERDLIVSFGADEDDLKLKEFSMNQFNSFFNDLVIKKRNLFTAFIDASLLNNPEIITEDVPNPDTFYTKTIPLTTEIIGTRRSRRTT